MAERGEEIVPPGKFVVVPDHVGGIAEAAEEKADLALAPVEAQLGIEAQGPVEQLSGPLRLAVPGQLLGHLPEQARVVRRQLDRAIELGQSEVVLLVAVAVPRREHRVAPGIVRVEVDQGSRRLSPPQAGLPSCATPGQLVALEIEPLPECDAERAKAAAHKT